MGLLCVCACAMYTGVHIQGHPNDILKPSKVLTNFDDDDDLSNNSSQSDTNECEDDSNEEEGVEIIVLEEDRVDDLLDIQDDISQAHSEITNSSLSTVFHSKDGIYVSLGHITSSSKVCSETEWWSYLHLSGNLVTFVTTLLVPCYMAKVTCVKTLLFLFYILFVMLGFVSYA